MEQEDTIGIIELEMLKLVRHLETVGRKSSLYGEVDRAGYLVLRTLANLGPMSVNAVAQSLRLDPSTVTRQLTKLAAGGSVERRLDPLDRRSALISLTAAGRRTMRSIERKRRRQTEVLLGDWSEAERVTFGQIMTKLNNSILDNLVDVESTSTRPRLARV